MPPNSFIAPTNTPVHNHVSIQICCVPHSILTITKEFVEEMYIFLPFAPRWTAHCVRKKECTTWQKQLKKDKLSRPHSLSNHP